MGKGAAEKDANDKVRGVLNGLDKNLTRVFLPWAIRNPRHLRHFGRLARSYKDAEAARALSKKAGLVVPPVMIISVTRMCNLSCGGCFATKEGAPDKNSNKARASKELGMKEWQRIIKESCGLGVFSFVLAGGEPFLAPGLLDLCETFDDRLFLIVTNGTMLKDGDFSRLKKLSNVCVIVSIEGDEKMTDNRRGAGVYKAACGTLKRLSDSGVLCGISVTVGRGNFDYWMADGNIDAAAECGARAAIFLEYIPTSPLCDCSGDRERMLTCAERAKFRKKILSYRENKPLYIIHSPGDEEYFGGCVSAGRGFAHITPSGDLTPCPVANIATHNLAKTPLRDALAAPFFKKIRESEGLLDVGDSPCALHAHPKEVDELVKDIGAYRTN